MNLSKGWIQGLMVLSVVLWGFPGRAQLPPAPPAPPVSPPLEDPGDPGLEGMPEHSPEASPDTNSGFIRPQGACPQEFVRLSALLVRDIPGYTNRILQSSVADIGAAYRPTYVITASQPERMPLDITERVYTTGLAAGESLQQLFFTTLERQYSGLEASSIEHFHWLFLAPSEQGWEMVFMFSTIAGDGDEALLPPRDSSQGSVGQAVQRWLRDCKVNAVLVE